MEPNSAVFCVGDDVYCVWDDEIANKNLRFIKGIQPDYFAHVAERHEQDIENDERAVFASVAIRTTYVHSMETALSLTFAAVQSPHCVFGWLNKYKIDHLQSLCDRVGNAVHFPNALRLDKPSWTAIVEWITHRMAGKLSDATFNREEVIEGYAHALARIGEEYCDDDVTGEYNSFKHGFRISPGGFSLAMRPEKTPNVEDLEAPMHSLGGSRFGSTTIATPKISNNRNNLSAEMISLNWNPHSLVARIQVTTAWIKCLKAFLITAESKESETVQWTCMKQAEDYKAPWYPNPGPSRFTMRTCNMKEDAVYPTAEELKNAYRRPDQP